MKNPCKQCLVDPICQVPCDMLVGFLEKYLPEPVRHNWMYGTIAETLRTREWRLTYIGNLISGIEYNV